MATATASKATTTTTRTRKSAQPADKYALSSANGKPAIQPTASVVKFPGTPPQVKPATSKPVTSKNVTAPKPTTAKPATSKPVTSKNVTAPKPTEAELLPLVSRFMVEGENSAEKLAGVLMDLYRIRAWEAHDSSAKDYFQKLGMGKDANDNEQFVLPPKARLLVVKTLFTEKPDTPVQHVASVTGAGVGTIKRDKATLKLVNPNRAEAQQNRTDGKSGTRKNVADDDEQPTAGTGSVKQVFSISDFIATQTDVDVLRMLITLAEERIADLESE